MSHCSLDESLIPGMENTNYSLYFICKIYTIKLLLSVNDHYLKLHYQDVNSLYGILIYGDLLTHA